MLLQDVRSHRRGRKAHVIADGVVAESDYGVGELVPHRRQRPQADLVVGRGVHRRAVHQGVAHTGAAKRRHSRGDRGQIVHARAQDHRLAEAGDVLDQRVVIALARADLVGADVHRLQPVRRRPRKRGGQIDHPLALANCQSVRKILSARLPMCQTGKTAKAGENVNCGSDRDLGSPKKFVCFYMGDGIGMTKLDVRHD